MRGRSTPRLLGFGALIVAGAVVGVVAERFLVRRQLSISDSEQIPDAAHSTHFHAMPVDDGAILHVEVDTPALVNEQTPTVILAHGFGMAGQAWWPQRRALRGIARVVVWDQRGHAGSMAARHPRSAPVTIDRLGADLAHIITTLDLHNVICVGHSMGGMTLMALAEQQPQWFGPRVIGMVLMGTTAGNIAGISLGLPKPLAQSAHSLAPRFADLAERNGIGARMINRVRGGGGDLARVIARSLAFGDDVPPGGVDMVIELLDSVPLQVISDLLVDLHAHDRLEVLSIMEKIPVLIVVGSRDALTPVAHSRAIAERLGQAELVVLPGVGHMLGLEQPGRVNKLLTDFVRTVGADTMQVSS